MQQQSSDIPRRIPRGVWILGFVSLLMDTSSEMVHVLLPLLLVGPFGASLLFVGIIEGVAEGTAQLIKLFSGALSDYFRRRKELTVCGYGLGALSKILFALASGTSIIFAARMIDRIGKGIRGAPRDALLTDITPPEIRGAAFGLRQTLDTIGAFLGPLIAVLLLLVWTENIQHIFWVAVIPGAGAVALLWFGLKEPEHKTEKKRTNPICYANLRQLNHEYWWVVLVGTAFTLARFSEAFLVILALDRGVILALIPLVMVVMSLAFSITAYPFGALSDRFSHRYLLALGLGVLIAADFVLGLSSSVMMLFIGIGLWGVHMGITEGLLSVMISKTAPSELRGTAFGFFGLIRGMMTMLASILAGAIWHYSGSTAAFLLGAALAALSFLILMINPKMFSEPAA